MSEENTFQCLDCKTEIVFHNLGRYKRFFGRRCPICNGAITPKIIGLTDIQADHIRWLENELINGEGDRTPVGILNELNREKQHD